MARTHSSPRLPQAQPQGHPQDKGSPDHHLHLPRLPHHLPCYWNPHPHPTWLHLHPQYWGPYHPHPHPPLQISFPLPRPWPS